MPTVAIMVKTAITGWILGTGVVPPAKPMVTDPCGVKGPPVTVRPPRLTAVVP